MADFSTKATDIQTTIEPSATLLNPVTREGEIEALGTIAQGVRKAATVVQTIRANAANAQANKFRADFSIKLNTLQDAHDQGAISDSEFRTRSRALLSQSLSNDPTQTEELLQDYSRFQSQSGLDKIAAPGVQKAELKQAAIKAAVDNGFLSLNNVGNPDAEAKAIEDLERFNSSMTELETQSKQLSVEASKLEVGSKQRAEKQAQLQETVKTGLAKIGRNALPYWRSQYENIKVRAAQATSEQERRQIIEEGVVALETDFAQRTASIAGDTLGVDQSSVDMIIAPQRKLLDVYIKELNGEYSTEAFERFVKSTEAQAKAMALEGLDNETLRWIGTAKLSDAIGAAISAPLATKVVDNLRKNASAAVPSGPGGERTKPADILPSSTDEKKSVNEYFNVLEQAMEDKAAGKYEQQGAEWNKEFDKELENQMAGVLKGVNVHSNSVESAKEFQPVIDFFASPVVGQYLQGKGIPTEMRADVARVLQDGYASQVVPMLRSELGTSTFNQVRVDGKVYQYNELFEPTMESGKFGFKLKQGIDGRTSLAARSTLRALNESAFTKVLNKMVISNAHIQGNTDYNASYEQIAPEIFQDMGVEQEVDETTTGAIEPTSPDLTIEDLMDFSLVETVDGTEEDVPENVMKAAEGPFTGTKASWSGKTDPIDIASSFKGVNEVEHANVISSFIKKTAGININPASTAWCAAFVNAVLGAGGGKGTGKLNARSFLDWGEEVETPSRGDVAVFSRGTSGWQGHVGFYVGTEEKDGKQYIRVLGGNQKNSVRESLYPASKLLGFRRAA